MLDESQALSKSQQESILLYAQDKNTLGKDKDKAFFMHRAVHQLYQMNQVSPPCDASPVSQAAPQYDALPTKKAKLELDDGTSQATVTQYYQVSP